MFVPVSVYYGPNNVSLSDSVYLYTLHYEYKNDTSRRCETMDGKTLYYGDKIGEISINTENIVFMDRKACRTRKGDIYLVELASNDAVWLDLNDMKKIWSLVPHVKRQE